MMIALPRHLRIDEDALTRILDREESLRVHFQPIIGFDSRAVVAAEALLRIRLDGIDISPADAISAATELGRLRELTRRVLDAACSQARRWQVAERPIAITVNAESSELADPLLADDIADTLARHGIEPELLQLELTETALMDPSPLVEKNLATLREMGVGLSLDDFGTGFASLSHLRNVPLTSVKLDRQFIEHVDVAGPDYEIVRSVIRLAHALGLRSVAEGVETEDQRRTLESLGCDAWQGFLESPALDADTFFDRLVRSTAETRAARSDRTGETDGDVELDSFVLRRIAATRWAHLGGFGRGAGWAGILDVDEMTTPLLAETLTSGMHRLDHDHDAWLFGPYHAGTALGVAVDDDTVVIYGSPVSTDMPDLPDEVWRAEASLLAGQITSVSPAKRLADELELSEALEKLVSNAPTTMHEAMRHVVESVSAALSCEFGVLYLSSGRLISFNDTTVRAEESDELVRALDALADATDVQRCVQDASAQPLPIPLPPEVVPRSWLAIPTAPALGGLLVCVHTDRQPRGFTTLCQRLGARLADAGELILHAALERERLHNAADRAAVMASQDALTGVQNRRGWNSALESIAPDVQVSVMIVDVNDLKMVNDQDGHAAGDELLVLAAKCLSAVVRSTDTVARLGGDEFGLLLPTANMSVMRRIESQLDDIVQLESRTHPRLSLAVGVASRRRDESIHDLVELADRRMYDRKRLMKAARSSEQRAIPVDPPPS